MSANSTSVAGRVAALILPVLLVGGCSMAGLPQFKGQPARAAVPVAEAAAAKEGGMSPAVTTDNDFVPLAFAPEPVRAAGNGEVNGLIAKYAALYDIPPSLLHRVVRTESGYNPGARNGPYLGLMQILPGTARTMGYAGPAAGLLDAETNLKYGAKYLRGAYLVAGFDQDRAVAFYRAGYYYDAKRAGLLEATGLR